MTTTHPTENAIKVFLEWNPYDNCYNFIYFNDYMYNDNASSQIDNIDMLNFNSKYIICNLESVKYYISQSPSNNNYPYNSSTLQDIAKLENNVTPYNLTPYNAVLYNTIQSDNKTSGNKTIYKTIYNNLYNDNIYHNDLYITNNNGNGNGNSCNSHINVNVNNCIRCSRYDESQSPCDIIQKHVTIAWDSTKRHSPEPPIMLSESKTISRYETARYNNGTKDTRLHKNSRMRNVVHSIMRRKSYKIAPISM